MQEKNDAAVTACEVDDQLCEMARWTIQKGLARDNFEANFFLVAIFIVITITTFLLAEATFKKETDTGAIRSFIEDAKADTLNSNAF